MNLINWLLVDQMVMLNHLMVRLLEYLHLMMNCTQKQVNLLNLLQIVMEFLKIFIVVRD